MPFVECAVPPTPSPLKHARDGLPRAQLLLLPLPLPPPLLLHPLPIAVPFQHSFILKPHIPTFLVGTPATAARSTAVLVQLLPGTVNPPTTHWPPSVSSLASLQHTHRPVMHGAVNLANTVRAPPSGQHASSTLRSAIAPPSEAYHYRAPFLAITIIQAGNRSSPWHADVERRFTRH
ncbi:uncharacterized protein SETTUDRAFT_32044 [Exserohilum turcica Et28A]|uniref:Uncharacterized protein n=1 Tax=Exserohilum turcicum (strain 28A) TaxID=671987 RepID=R0IHZ1_EXST2|nr:uncharacterized protein SETTUDRAFT_32044 [Exserohilum turcica Et28A]EOA84805.1 hypothetical protein SETTUDRAFT_32044 [Exserohilum turcica Et28A]